jgi:hypothetical protein
VLASPTGRAVSTDGANWEIQLQAPRPAAWGSLNSAGATDYARYAVWSAEEGLARFPRFPTTIDNPALAADKLVVAILDASPRLPFALTDVYECWLCVAGQPVALVASAVAAPASRVVPRWRALTEDPEAKALEAAVAAFHGQSLWFLRAPDGSGRLLDGPKVGAASSGRFRPDGLPAGGTAAYAPDAFPETLLSAEAFAGTPACEQVVAYLHRLAARLLMLPLRPATRAALEQAAIADAAGVAHFHRLYPAQSDPALITRLRVEARLRAAA